MRTSSATPAGRASDDAIRSLAISYKLLGTREWFVIHHSNCGMEFYFPALYAGSVTVFLCGSVLFLVGALCSALLERGPSS